MTDTELLNITIATVITNRAQMQTINRLQAAGIDILAVCPALFGWANPRDTIARGEMNAAQFVQALHLARTSPDN